MTLAKEGIKEGVKSYAKGGKMPKGLRDFGKVALPIAKDLGMTLAKEGIKEGVKSYAKSGGKRFNVGKTFKSVGKALKPVGKTLAPVAQEVFRDVIVPEGKKALRDYIRNMGKSSGEGGEYDGEVVYATPYYGKGMGGSKASGMVQALIAGKPTVSAYQPFSLSKMSNPSADLQSKYGKKPRKPRAKKQFIIEDDEEMEIIPVKKPRKPRAKKQFIIEEDDEEDLDGGVLIRDFPREFHSSVYPPALASYTADRDAYGRGRAKGGARGGARGAIVKEVMAKHGLSLPQASKFVKEHGLY
jgi:hypothetical protein